MSTVYRHKLEIIQNNLYGVDVDVFAVNIARLRLWLSLAVDYEEEKPQPLPNLKYKIDVGDSLITPNPTEIKLTDVLIEKYRQVKAQYIKTHNSNQKKKLVAEIIKLKKDISLITYGNDKVDKFDWSLDFAEVFADGGFDIVVANPPYIRQELIKHLKPSLKKVFPEVYTGTADLYCFFYARALELLKKGGMLAFISSNKWLRAKYGEKLRKYIAGNCQVQSITDFGELPVFKSASTFPMIFICQETNKSNPLTFTQVNSLDSPYPNILEIIKNKGNVLHHDTIKDSNWILTDTKTFDKLKQMSTVGIPLKSYVEGHIYYGLKTGCDKAFIVNSKVRQELISRDPNCIKVFKPLIHGDAVRKYRINRPDKWLIFAPWDFSIERYPSIKMHLQKYRHVLEKRPEVVQNRYQWYCLGRYGSKYHHLLVKPKIVYPEIAMSPRFTLDTEGTYTLKTVFSIPVYDLYLLGVLNSKCVWDYLKIFCSVLGNAEKRGRLTLQSIYINKVPIPDTFNSEKEAISKLVQKCLDAKGVDSEAWEKEIDNRVAALYGL